MNKELLNKILPYCGYNLKAIYEDDIVDVCISSSGTRRISTEHLLTKSRDDTYHYKPILFPPNCLTEEIETEYGKEDPLKEIGRIMHQRVRSRETLLSMICADDLTEAHKVFKYLYSRHIAFNLKPDEYVSVESLEKNTYAHSETNN